MNVNELVIKESDYEKLTALVDSSRTPAAERLEDELSRAEIVPDSQYPKDVVWGQMFVLSIWLQEKKMKPLLYTRVALMSRQ